MLVVRKKVIGKTYVSSLRVCKQHTLGVAHLIDEGNISLDDGCIRSSPAGHGLLVVLVEVLNREARSRVWLLVGSVGVGSNSEGVPGIGLVGPERSLGVDLRVLRPS